METMEGTDIIETMECTDAEDNHFRGSLKYRGIAVIAIFSKFHKMKDIEYAEEDRKLLMESFSKLQYGVVLWNNLLSLNEFSRRLKEVSSDPFHSECETFAMVIITHGNSNGELNAYDTHFNREDVYKYFKAKECKSLENKLKLFIFHACRGKNEGAGVLASGNMNDDLQFVNLEDHLEKDFLILCSTFEGTVAIGPEERRGSWFIRALSDVMKEEGDKHPSERKNILALLTSVMRKTASVNFRELPSIVKQQPVMMMALHKMYYFFNKTDIAIEKLKKHQHQ